MSPSRIATLRTPDEVAARRIRRERLVEASSGDVAHALAVLAEVERVERARLRLVASRGAGANEHEPQARPLDVLQEVERPRRPADGVCLVWAVIFGLVGWLVAGLIGYAAWLIAGWLT